MRNLMIIFAGIFCLFCIPAFAGEKEALHRKISLNLRAVTFYEIREIYDRFKPTWQTLNKELLALQQLPLNTKEQVEATRKNLEKIKRSCTKIELIKIMSVLVAGTVTEGDNLPEGEIENTIAKILELEIALKKTENPQELMRIKLRLIGMGWSGVGTNSHALVTQYALKWYFKTIKQGNVQLMVWWEKNNKSATGLEKLKTFQKILSELEPGTNSMDKRQLSMLHMRLAVIECETLVIFKQEP